MKNVLLIRHAKSDWNNADLKDFDRPLNKRGLRDAPDMAERLLEKGIKIDAFVTSPALRAITTCRFFAKAYGREKDIIAYKDLYNAPPQIFSKAIKSMDNKSDTIAIFAHNPGITDFANSLTHTRIDDMPTCAIFAVKSEAETWAAFEKAKKELLFFDYPKNE